MSLHKREPLTLPDPPSPLTPMLLMAYLESIVEFNEVEGEPILINGYPLVSATLEDGKVALRTWCDELNRNPPCPRHNPVQHRDGKPPWCDVCMLTKYWKNPHKTRDQ